jgi:hypothetical protein
MPWRVPVDGTEWNALLRELGRPPVSDVYERNSWPAGMETEQADSHHHLNLRIVTARSLLWLLSNSQQIDPDPRQHSGRFATSILQRDADSRRLWVPKGNRPGRPDKHQVSTQ